MQNINKLMEILACPKCLGVLELKDILFETEKGGIIEKRLYCKLCELNFQIKEDIPIFGLKAENKTERESEMNAEIEWELTANIQEHIEWAKKSSIAGERMIQVIKEKLKNSKILRVLDVGAGVGAFHSWQFSKHGFEVVAVEICPEFLFSIDYFDKENVFFERVVTDCTILPFRDISFDIVFCKELIHHIEYPMKLLSEMWRVLRPNGLIAIEEPCISILIDKNKAFKEDKAANLGITHHYYTYYQYMDYIKRIVINIETGGEMLMINSSKHPILSWLQKCLIGHDKKQNLRFRKFFLKMQLTFLGGSVELIGIKRRKYTGEEHKREVIPITLEKLNSNAMKFYHNELIPSILNVFWNTHKNRY